MNETSHTICQCHKCCSCLICFSEVLLFFFNGGLLLRPWSATRDVRICEGIECIISPDLSQDSVYMDISVSQRPTTVIRAPQSWGDTSCSVADLRHLWFRNLTWMITSGGSWKAHQRHAVSPCAPSPPPPGTTPRLRISPVCWLSRGTSWISHLSCFYISVAETDRS